MVARAAMVVLGEKSGGGVWSGLVRSGVRYTACSKDQMKSGRCVWTGERVSGGVGGNMQLWWGSFVREVCSSSSTTMSVYGGDEEMERLTKSQRRNRMRRHKQKTKIHEQLEHMRIASSEDYDGETLASALPVRDRVYNARLLRAVETALGGIGSSGGGGGRRSGAGRVSHDLSAELGFCVEEVRTSSKRETAYIRYGCLPGREERTEACVQSNLGRIRRLVARALDVRRAPQLLFKPTWASGGDSAAAMSDAFRRIEEELRDEVDEDDEERDTESAQRTRRGGDDDAV